MKSRVIQWSLLISNLAIRKFSLEAYFVCSGFSEKIVGYKGLRVTLVYSDLSMYSYLRVEYDGLMTEMETNLEPDNIRKKILETYPDNQQDCLIEEWSKFDEVCQNQRVFKPFGEKINDFSFGGRKYQLHKVTENTPAFDEYMSRIQTLTLWFIEGVKYTDNSDPRFMHYLLLDFERGLDNCTTFCLDTRCVMTSKQIH